MMGKLRLDIDECALYRGELLVAQLQSDGSNDGWREACRVGQEIVDLEYRAEVLHAEREQARAKADYFVKLLTGIHALLYPAPVTTADGSTMVFRPKSLDPHEVLQELSDRIRALPDKLAAIEKGPEGPSLDPVDPGAQPIGPVR